MDTVGQFQDGSRRFWHCKKLHCSLQNWAKQAAVTDSPDEERLGQQWQEEVEAVVKNMLLWAQNMHSLDAEVPPETGEGAGLLCLPCCI